MFAALLLVAIFSSALPFQAEALNPKCDQTVIAKIYDYWHKNNGVPQRVAEHNIKCYEREIALMSTQDYYDEDVTSVLVHHHASTNTLYLVRANNTADYHESDFIVFAGQTIHTLNKVISIVIAESNGVRLNYKCSRDVNAVEGPNQFLIRRGEGAWSEEGRDKMEKLMRETFGVTETMRTYTDSFTLLEGMEEAIDTCSQDSF